MTDLSIIIPSRNEMFLSRTIQDILEHMRGDTEIIAVLDGQWADPPIPLHPKVSIIYHNESIGQRAAMNEAAKISAGKYIMKCDAHCAFDEGFDVKLMADMQPEWTVVPIMRNLHVFDWICPNGHRRYQGPSGPCKECNEPTTMDIVWIAKTNPQSKSYCFDSEPHFQYNGEYTKRSEYKKMLEETGLTESMSLQGSCFMLSREKYFELNIADEQFGSWGSQGIEVAVKTWLSGGRVICNQKTWYGHCFRTQGGDFSFPYHLSGHQVENAKKRAKDLFFNNRWDKQIRPLSWLIKRFWPVKGWSQEDLDKLIASDFSTFSTTSVSSTIGNDRKEMSSDAASLSALHITSDKILGGSDQFEMGRITTTPVLTDDVIKNRDILIFPIRNGNDKPSIHEPMNFEPAISECDLSISILGTTSSPNPASCGIVNSNIGEQTINNGRGHEINDEHISIHNSIIPCDTNNVPSKSITQVEKIPTFGIVYYTDNRLDDNILLSCQRQLLKASGGNRIVSVSLKSLDFSDNIVLDLERGYLTMFKQILAGLEALDTDIVFFCEHDVLYHSSHFDFIPPQKDKYYYNLNCWKVRIDDGHALKYDTKQTSQLCAYRELLVQHYKERIRRVEAEGFSRKMGFEPGSHGRAERVDDYKSDTWNSELPNIDIRHSQNLTSSRWRQDQFRDQRNCQNWQEAEEVTPWYKQGEFIKLLEAKND